MYRHILTLPPRNSASAMYANYNIDSFETLLRKRTFGFIERLEKSENSIIECLNNSWIMKIDVWNCWNRI